MDIENKLHEGHSRAITNAVVEYVGNDKNKFKILIDLFLGKVPKLIQRGGWPMSLISIAHPELIKPYLGKLIIKLQQENNHPSVARNILKIFEAIEIPEKYEGYLVDCCFAILVSPANPIASIAFAITVATKICVKYPDLKNELRLHLEQMQSHPVAPAIKVRIKRAIKEL